MTNTIRIRVIAMPDEIEEHAKRVIAYHERDGYECIEWSKVYPCRGPEEGMAKIYLSFIKCSVSEGELYGHEN